VLDCFAGSGTTLVAADELGRNWIGIDNSPEAWRTILHRFSKGSEPMGDFVSKRDKDASKSQPLFDVLPGGLDSVSVPVVRIDGFSVFASSDEVDVVRRTVGV
jgi:hypothetical protein